MSTPFRLLVIGCVSVALGITFEANAPRAFAAPDDGPKADVEKIADALQKGDTKTAEELAKAVVANVKDDLEEVMHLMSLRSAKGVGIGPKPGAIKPDGIEAKIQNWTKRVAPNELKGDEAKAYQRMAYITAAIGQVAMKSDKGSKNPAQWKKWSEEMSTTAQKLAKDIEAGNPAEVKKTATALDNTCRNCHGVFRDN
jgi:hypothetical protein